MNHDFKSELAEYLTRACSKPTFCLQIGRFQKLGTGVFALESSPGDTDIFFDLTKWKLTYPERFGALAKPFPEPSTIGILPARTYELGFTNVLGYATDNLLPLTGLLFWSPTPICSDPERIFEVIETC